MVEDVEHVIVRTAARIVIPFMQLFGLYVYVHGHGSPGGGFQGGCLVAASFILIAIVWGLDEARRQFTEKANIVCCSLGVFIYAATGFVPLLFSANFLDYGEWRHIFHSSGVMARYYCIALVELGVQLVVTGVMYSIFFDLVLSSRYSKDRWGE